MNPNTDLTIEDMEAVVKNAVKRFGVEVVCGWVCQSLEFEAVSLVLRSHDLRTQAQKIKAASKNIYSEEG